MRSRFVSRVPTLTTCTDVAVNGDKGPRGRRIEQTSRLCLRGAILPSVLIVGAIRMPITFEYPGPEYFPETHPTPEQLEPVHDACRYIFDANKTAHRENYDHPFHESVLGFDSLSDVDDVDDSGHHRKRRPGDVGRTVVELRM